MLWFAGLVAVCAQAASFWSCSFGTVTPLPVMPPPTNPKVSVNVAPASITLGQSSLLSWSATGVSACSASGAWSGPQSLQGSMKVAPSTPGTFSYVLNCTIAPTGSIAQSATLTVSAMDAVSASNRHLTVRRTDLVSDVPGTGAVFSDPDLSEPWGLALPAGTSAVLANRHSNRSTSYDGRGRESRAAQLRLRLPFVAEDVTTGASGAVANSSDGFVVSLGAKSAPARVLFGSTGGVIAAWSPEIDEGRAVVVHVSRDLAAYTGLAIAASSTPGETRLYAADFRHGRIDVFDGTFRRQSPTETKFAFTDPDLPSGYSPFGIAVDGELVYVAYAQPPAPFAPEPVAGAGLGLIDVFTSTGVFITRLVPAGTMLNAPWAMVSVPEQQTLPLARALLVANTGDGTIAAFDLQTGAWLGALEDARGAVLVIPRLHALAFGNGAEAQSPSALFFTAGAARGAHGSYGRLDFDIPGAFRP